MMLIKSGMQPIGCNSAFILSCLNGEFAVGNHVTVLKMKQFHCNDPPPPVPLTLSSTQFFYPNSNP